MRQPTVIVNFSGDIYPESELKNRLDAAAKACRGSHAGGGTDFSTRDESWEFRSKKSAANFARRARRFKAVNSVEIFEI